MWAHAGFLIQAVVVVVVVAASIHYSSLMSPFSVQELVAGDREKRRHRHYFTCAAPPPRVRVRVRVMVVGSMGGAAHAL